MRDERRGSIAKYDFDWDEWNLGHIAPHAVIPEEAEQAAQSDILIVDSGWVDGEYRFRAVGETRSLRILEFVFSERQHKTRIISAWTAPRVLKKDYLQWRATQ